MLKLEVMTEEWCVQAYRRYLRLGPLSFDEILSQKVGFMDEPSGAEYGVLVAGESSEYRHVMAVECFTHYFSQSLGKN